MMFTIKALLIFGTLLSVQWAQLISPNDNSSTSNTTIINPKPSPPSNPPVPLDPVHVPDDPVSPTPDKPTPKPKPKPAPPVVVISKDHVTEAKVPTTSLSEYQRFGHSVASYGSAVAVGTSKESLSPAVYKYSLEVSSTDSDGQLNVTCSELKSLSAPAGSNTGDAYYDGFGLSVALSAQALMVAAPFRSTELAATSSSGYATGAVFAFSAVSTVSSEALQRLVPSSPNANMQFGSALALCGNTLVVGAPGANAMGQMSGAAYVYSYNNETSSWDETEVLQDVSGGAAFAQFGSAVFLSDDATVLAVGASGYSKHAVHGGAVFMYSRTASPLVNDTDIDGDSGSSASVYTLQSILVPSEPHGYAYFGHTVHFRGPVGLVSAYDENGSGVVYLYDLQHHALSTDVTDFKQAAAYLCKGCFLRGMATLNTQASWTLREVLRPLVATPINQFGASLAIFHTSDAGYSSNPFLADAYVVAVGAPGDVTTALAASAHAVDAAAAALSNAQMFAGSVYLYLGPHNFTSASTNTLVSSDKWTFISKILANDSSAYDAYGRSLSLMGAHLLVGAELANSEDTQKTGAVYLETNLIPYLVAAAQQREEEEQTNGGGGGSSSGDESAWAQFMAFFSTSGGIVTMSFLPIAVLLVVFVAHSKTKGKPVLSSAYSCKARLLGESGAHLPRASSEKGPDPDASSGEKQVLATDSAHLSTVFDHSTEETPVSPTRPENAATATDSTPSLWERLQHFLRNPLHTSGHVPLSPVAEAEPQASMVTPQTDLRLQPPVVGRTSGQAVEAGLSIRSPITHIPLHSHLVSSPLGRNPSPAPAARSFRVEHTHQRSRGRSMSGAESEESATLLVVTPGDLAKLKQQLNAEFPGPGFQANHSRTPSVDSLRKSGEKATLAVSGGKKDVKLGDTHTLRV